MKTKIFKKGLFTRVVVFIIVVSFIFTSVPLGVYASWGRADKLRTEAKANRDGGDEIKADLVIKSYQKKIGELQPKVTLTKYNQVEYERQSAPLIELVNELIPRDIHKDYILKIISKDYLLKIISTATGIINSNTKGYLFAVAHPEFLFQTIHPNSPGYAPAGEMIPINLTPAYTSEALLINLSVGVIKETLVLINTLGIRLMPSQISYIEAEIKPLKIYSERAALLLSFNSFNENQEQLSLADGGQIGSLINDYKNKVHEKEPEQILAGYRSVYERKSTPLIELVESLNPQNISNHYLLGIIYTAIQIIHTNTGLYQKKSQLAEFSVMENIRVAYTPEALVIGLSRDIITETFEFINKLGFSLTQRNLADIEDSLKSIGIYKVKDVLLSSFDSLKNAQSKGSRFSRLLMDGGQVIPGKQDVLENLRDPVPGTIFYAVIPHTGPDTDAAVSAIGEVYRINEIAKLEGKNIVVFPVIQGEINDETKYALDLVGINPNDLIFFEEVEDLLVALEKKNAILQITLTDHSTIPGKQENLALLEEKLDWAIDHHLITKIKPEKTVYAEVGSTNTLIFERFRDSKVEIPKNLALLMLSAILSDTKNLEVNVTDRDIEAVKKLMEILNYSEVDRKNLFIKQTYVLNTIDEKKSFTKPLEKILSNLRYYPPEQPEYSFTTFGLNFDERDLFKNLWPEILEYIKTDTQKRNLDVALFNLTHLNKEGGLDKDKLEEFFVIGPEYNALEYIKASQVPYEGEIEEIKTPYKDISIYKLNHKGGAARKATVARISEYFEYIQAENIVYTASGGKIFERYRDNLMVKVDGIPRLDGKLGKPRLLIVAPNLFLGGIKNLLTEVAKLGKGIRIAAYEVNAKNLEEDIISAEKLDDILEKLPNMGIKGANTILLRTTEDSVDEEKLKGMGIRQIVVKPGMAPLGLAKAIKELLGDTYAKSVFTIFLEEMVTAKVISPVSEDIQNKILEKLKEGAIFEFPEDVKVTDKVTKEIGEAKEKVEKFVKKFI